MPCSLTPLPHAPCHSNHLLVQLAKLYLCGAPAVIYCKTAAEGPPAPVPLCSVRGGSLARSAWLLMLPPTPSPPPPPARAAALTNAFIFSNPGRASRAYFPLLATSLVQLAAVLVPSAVVYRMEMRMRRRVRGCGGGWA